MKETKLYEVLHVQPEASQTEIKRAYRLMALKYHPDKNKHSVQSTEMFQEITKAYGVLSDVEQRAIYDKFGEQGLSHNIPTTTTVDPTPHTSTSQFFTPFNMKRTDDLFSQFFGDNFFKGSATATASASASASTTTSSFFNDFTSTSASSSSRQQAPQQPQQVRIGPKIKHKLHCTLEELYNGKTTKLGLSKTVLCTHCNAKGGLNVHYCQLCQGLGRISRHKQIGAIVQRFETTCRSCNGSGEYIDPKDLCPVCLGNKTMDERKILELSVVAGSKDGDTIVFSNEGDQGVGFIPGDVVVTLVQEPHDTFERRGPHLFTKVKIDLLTALTGGVFSILHLNGEWLQVEIVKGQEIIKPRELKVLKGFGMPKRDAGNVNSSTFGDLIIEFDVVFPELSQLNENGMEKLINALPSSNTFASDGNQGSNNADLTERVFLSDYDPYYHNEKYKRKRKRPEVNQSNNWDQSSYTKNVDVPSTTTTATTSTSASTSAECGQQ